MESEPHGLFVGLRDGSREFRLAVFANFMDCANIRVFQYRSGFCFPDQPLLGLFVGYAGGLAAIEKQHRRLQQVFDAGGV